MTTQMATCQQCKSTRIAVVGGKVSDRFWATMDVEDGTPAGREVEHHGYVPQDMGLGRGGDYFDMMYCLTCGQIQADRETGVKFPVPPCKLETDV